MVTVVSLFAGCGGSSLGYRLAGYKEMLAVEWDDNAAETFKLNFPEVPLYHGDICKLTTLDVGAIDLLDGSPPCQGFSMAGRRKSTDPRNSLFKEYVRVLEMLKPRAFLFENVTGLIQGDMRAVYNTIIKVLRECGYNAHGEVLNAMYYNVPQSRERVIIIGVRNDLNLSVSFPKPQTKPISAGEALRGVQSDPEELAMLLHAGKTKPSFKYWSLVPVGKALPSVFKTNSGFSCVRIDPTKPMRTVCKNHGLLGPHGPMHWSEQRRFTVAEYKRFSSFPDTFRFVGTYTDAVARMGNCVPPNLIRAVAEHIKDTILR